MISKDDFETLKQYGIISLHSSALTRGYVSRKPRDYPVHNYSGRHGNGFYFDSANHKSTRFSIRNYYIISYPACTNDCLPDSVRKLIAELKII